MKWSDRICKLSFVESMKKFNDYSKAIIREDNLEEFMYISKDYVFPEQWEIIASIRKVNDNRTVEVSSGRVKYSRYFV